MTFKEKLKELHDDSLSTQKEFLVVVQEIRAIATKGDALTEELIFKRDTLYTRFDKVLKLHRRIMNYATKNSIDLDNEYTEGMDLF